MILIFRGGYPNKHPSIPRVTTKESPNCSRNLAGTINLPLASIVCLYSPMNILLHHLTKKDARAFVRFFYSAATECEIDKQGRINIPKSLRTHAALQKKCVVVGVSNRFEIWSEDRWDAFADEAEENFDDIAENMIDFDL